MGNYDKLHSTRLYEQIVDKISEQIIDKELREGDRLPNENELSIQFGVSRTVVREAKRALVNKGLIVVRHGSGTFVSNQTSQAFGKSLDLAISIEGADKSAHLVETREILEPTIAERAATRATPEDIALLQEAIQTMDDSLEDINAFVAADHQFHLLLAHATQNILLPKLIDSIVDLLNDQRRSIFHLQDSSLDAQQYHKRILQAVIDHNPQEAHQAMSQHLERTRKLSEIASEGP